MTKLDKIIKDFEIEKEIENELRKKVNDPDDINGIDFKLSWIMSRKKKESCELKGR